MTSDGGTLVTCSGGWDFGDRRVRIWDTQTGALRREFSRPQSAGRFVALSPDGNTVATNGTGKSIALWDVRTGRLVTGTGQGIPTRFTNRRCFPPRSAGSTNQRRKTYRNMKVWEVADGRLLATMVTFSDSRAGLAADDWLAYTAAGFYEGSSGIDRYLAWRVGDDLQSPDSFGPRLHRPDRLAATLKLPIIAPDSH